MSRFLLVMPLCYLTLLSVLFNSTGFAMVAVPGTEISATHSDFPDGDSEAEEPFSPVEPTNEEPDSENNDEELKKQETKFSPRRPLNHQDFFGMQSMHLFKNQKVGRITSTPLTPPPECK